MFNIASFFGPASAIPLADAARAFSEPFGDNLKEWWRVAPQGYWMLWVAGQCNVADQLLIAAATDCVETALVFVPLHRNDLTLALGVVRSAVDSAPKQELLRKNADETYNLTKTFCQRYGLAGGRVGTAVGLITTAPIYRDQRQQFLDFLVVAALHAAGAARDASNEDEYLAMHRRHADIVRSMIPLEEVLAGWTALQQ